jgi:dienelactone hydrolase
MDFSPSIVHRAWTAQTVPGMRYAGDDVAEWQRRLRARLVELLGYGRLQGPRGPLNPRSFWRREHPLGSIEKIVFTAEAGADVPAYVCLPKQAEPPYLWFICLQGHTTGMHNSIGVDYEETTPIDVEGDRAFALGCMARGIAALCIEQRSFGLRREFIQPQHLDYLCHQAAMNALVLGTTLLAERLFDVDRAIDYLTSRGDVDMDRFGVMGESGGGTVALFSAALLPRVRAAMPVCSFSTFRDSIQAMFHCVCNYVPGILQVAEMGDIAGLIAPRPLVIVSGREDDIFPLGPAQAEFARVQAIYDAAGAPGNCQHVVGEGGHRFYADDAWPVMLAKLEKAGTDGSPQEPQ